MTHTIEKKPCGKSRDGQTVLTVTDETVARSTRTQFRFQHESVEPNGRPRLVVCTQESGSGDEHVAIVGGAALAALRDELAKLPPEAFENPIVWTDGDVIRNANGGLKRVRINGLWRWVGNGTASASSDQTITGFVRSGDIEVLLNQASS